MRFDFFSKIVCNFWQFPVLLWLVLAVLFYLERLRHGHSQSHDCYMDWQKVWLNYICSSFADLQNIKWCDSTFSFKVSEQKHPYSMKKKNKHWKNDNACRKLENKISSIYIAWVGETFYIRRRNSIIFCLQMSKLTIHSDFKSSISYKLGVSKYIDISIYRNTGRIYIVSQYEFLIAIYRDFSFF